jgi:uncharacterized membrane protein YccC
MFALDRAALLFSVKSFCAAMLALYIAFYLDVAQPYWAMATVYIVTHPLSGAVRSKAVYRVLGTLLGAAVAVALVPNLVNAPVLLSLAIALWVGVCLAISLLDRTPRSYLMMLAGYTAAIIGFPCVSQPGAVFDIAVARVIEICLGIICATLVHSLVFPSPVGDALRRRLAVWLADADRWALDILQTKDAAVTTNDRRHLAAAASEIHILSVHLPFDTSRLRETTAAVLTLHGRMVLLIPLLSGLADRMTALAHIEDAEVRAVIDAVARWIESGASRSERAALIRRIEDLARERRRDDWTGLLVESLLVRLADMVAVLGDSHELRIHLNDPDSPLEPELAALVAQAERRPMHRDLPLALLSGAAAMVAISVSCAIWIGTGWSDGAAAAIMTSLFCCLFATLDDPVPAIRGFALFWLATLPIGVLYVFAILPAIDGYPMLAAVLMPAFVFLGALIPNPKTAGAATAAILGLIYAVTLQSSYSADFASFMNLNLGQYVGMLVSIVVTASMRSIGVEASIRRLQAHAWQRLAQLARARAAPGREDFAAAVVDRLGLLTPKLAAASGQSDAMGPMALRDVRVGMNLVALQELRQGLSGALRANIDAVLASVGDYFASHTADDASPSGEAVLGPIDRALGAFAGLQSSAVVRGITALVGLRRNLFPHAAYAPASEMTPEVP